MAFNVRIGDLRHRLAIQENTPTTDGLGEETPSWATLETVNGSIRPVSANEPMRGFVAAQDVTHEITIRYLDYIGTSDTELLPKYRFTYDSRNFNIKGILNIEERNRFLVCQCHEEV